MAHETVRQYINRYRRIEKDLESIGISSGAMYDNESRGNRILERTKLSPEFQRLVLIGAGNTLDYDRICESLLLQFPDFKPIPPIHVAGYQGSSSSSSGSWRPQNLQRGGARPFSSSSSTAASSSNSAASSKGSGKRFPRRVFQTEHHTEENAEQDENAKLETVQEGDEENEEFEDAAEECQPDDVAADEYASTAPLEETLAEIADVLTVTSKKLQSSVLGRKFTGRRSIEDRKRTSSCSACGQMGHWAGDAVCQVSSGQKGRGSSDGGKGAQKGKGKNSNFTPKKAFMVSFPQELDGEQPPQQSEQQTSSHTTYFTYMTLFKHDDATVPVAETFVTETIDFAGFMVLDTACQRSCCSQRWLDVHQKLLSRHRLSVKCIESEDVFQFGAGRPRIAKQRAYIPIGFQGQDWGILFGASVVDACIPFLASRSLMDRLGCIIDFEKRILHMKLLGISIPLKLKHGHLAVSIADFHSRIRFNNSWSDLSHDHIWQDPDPELVIAPQVLVSSPQQQGDHAFSRASCISRPTGMAQVADHIDDGAFQDVQGDGQDGEIGISVSTMDDGTGDSRSHRGAEERDDPSNCSATQFNMHTSDIQEVRQCTRQLRPVQSLPDEVQVAPRSQRLGATWKSKVASFFTLATALLFNHPSDYDYDGIGSNFGQGQTFLQQQGFGEGQGEGKADDFSHWSNLFRGDSNLGEGRDDPGGVRRCDDGLHSLRFRQSGCGSTIGHWDYTDEDYLEDMRSQMSEL